MSSTNIGLAGEFYVLAQLAQMGFAASLTLANTKGVDILVFGEDPSLLRRVEVKTTNRGPRRERLFSTEPAFGWPMSVKHEALSDPDLFFCFVVLQGANTLPLFFVVPSAYVAGYVREEHAHYLRSRNLMVSPTPMRRFRIAVSDPHGFRDQWDLLRMRKLPPGKTRVSEPWLPSRRGR